MLFSMADAAGLFRLIAALYPREQAFANADKQLVGVWHSMLLDLPAAVISDAVKVHAATSKFAPSIAEIREGAIKLLYPEYKIGSGEAWGMVVDTLRKGVSKPVLEALPDCVRTAVKAVGGWYMIARSESPDTVRAQFMRAYDQAIDGAMRERQQPPRTAMNGGERCADMWTKATHALNAPSAC